MPVVDPPEPGGGPAVAVAARDGGTGRTPRTPRTGGSPGRSAAVPGAALALAAVGLAVVLGHQVPAAWDLAHDDGFLGAAAAQRSIVVHLVAVAAVTAGSVGLPRRALPVLVGVAALAPAAALLAVAVPGGQALHVAMALATMASMWWIGDTALGWRPLGVARLREHVVVAWSLGFGITGLVVLLAAHAHVARWWTLGLALLATAAAGARRAAPRLGPALRRLPGELAGSRSEAAAAGACLVLGAWAVIWAGAPEVQYDALYGKGWVPGQIAATGHSVPLADHPHLGLHGFGQLVPVPGRTLGGAELARYLQLAVAVLLVVTLWRAGRRAGGALGPILAVVAASTPHLIWQSSTGNDDLLLAALALAAALAVIDLGADRPAGPGAHLVVGALCGTCMAGKLHLAVFAAALAVLWSVRMAPRRRLPVALGLVAAGGALIAAPDFAVRWIETGNPVFPQYNDIFESPDFPPINSSWDLPFLEAGGLRTLVGLPWRIIDRPDTMMQTAPVGAFGLLVVVLGAGVLLGWRQRGGRRTVWLAVLVALAAWWVQLRYLRYLLPYAFVAAVLAAPALAPAVTAGRDRLRAAWAERAAVLATGLVAAAFLPTTVAQFWNVPDRVPLSVAVGAEDREAYRLQAIPDATVLGVFSDLAEPGDILVGDPFPRALLPHDLDLTPLWEAQLELQTHGPVPTEPEALYRAWQDIGLGWYSVSFERRLLHRAAPDVDAMLALHGEMVFSGQQFDLWRLVDEPATPDPVPVCDPTFSVPAVDGAPGCWGAALDATPGLTEAESPGGAVQVIPVCPGTTYGLTATPDPASTGAVMLALYYRDASGAIAEDPGGLLAYSRLDVPAADHGTVSGTAPPGAVDAVLTVAPLAPGAAVSAVQVEGWDVAGVCPAG